MKQISQSQCVSDITQTARRTRNAGGQCDVVACMIHEAVIHQFVLCHTSCHYLRSIPLAWPSDGFLSTCSSLYLLLVFFSHIFISKHFVIFVILCIYLVSWLFSLLFVLYLIIPFFFYPLPSFFLYFLFLCCRYLYFEF